MFPLLLLAACGAADPAGAPLPLEGAAAPKTASPNLHVEDRDAACGWAAVQVGVAAQREYADRFDVFMEAMPTEAELPLPTSCAGRVSLWVAEVEALDTHTCARLRFGAGRGRSFCAALDGEVYEQVERVLSDPAEPGAPPADGILDLHTAIGQRLYEALDPADSPPAVTIDPADGRTVAALPRPLALRCAREALAELVRAEQSHDAAFDTYSADYAELGFALEQLLSCPAWVGVHVASVGGATGFEVEAAVLQGTAAGTRYAASRDAAVHPAPPVTPDRAALSAAGWLLGEAPP